MPDPTTGNKLFDIPSHGTQVNTWDVPLNADWSAADGMLGGTLTLGVSAASTILLTVPATGSVSPGAGPTQSQNALIKFTGALAGNQIVQFTLPGYYIVQNLCSNNASFFVQLAPASGTGSIIAAPPGRKCHVFFDGTSMDYVNAPEVGAYMDLAVATTPLWMTNCSIAPWLVCDGTVYNSSNYTALSATLGSSFGGNGVTTFAVPDLRARIRLPLDNQGAQGTAGRVTAAGAGINGTTIGASGGSQFLHGHNHVATTTDPGHVHGYGVDTGQPPSGTQGPFSAAAVNATLFVASATTNVSVSIGITGAGASQNVQPALVHGMTFIKT